MIVPWRAMTFLDLKLQESIVRFDFAAINDQRYFSLPTLVWLCSACHYQHIDRLGHLLQITQEIELCRSKASCLNLFRRLRRENQSLGSKFGGKLNCKVTEATNAHNSDILSSSRSNVRDQGAIYRSASTL
jgi:hypothetical protein